MPLIKFTEEDLSKGKQIKPGKYSTEISQVKTRTHTDGSINWDYSFRILDGDYKGVTRDRTYNSKAPGYLKYLIQAIEKRSLLPGDEFDPEALQGKRVGVTVIDEVWQGRPVNKISDDFYSLDSITDEDVPF